MTTRTRKITAAEFWTMPDDPSHRYELVDGELVDMDGTPRHGRTTGHIYKLVSDHIAAESLPLDVGVNTGFTLDPRTTRFPDVHVTPWERMAAYDEDAGGFPIFAPDVAIEVVSTSNTPSALARKTEGYFAGGTRAVWIADPNPRTVAIRRPGMPEQFFGPGDMLSGDSEIPGFACAVADIFAVLEAFERRAAAETDAAGSGRQ